MDSQLYLIHLKICITDLKIDITDIHKGFEDRNNSMLPRKLQNRENSQSIQQTNKENSRRNKGILTVLWVLFVTVNAFSD